MSSGALPPPPAGVNYIAVIQISVSFLMVGTVFSSILVSIFTALFFFSDSKSRRRPIFILNICAVLLGIAEGGINIHIEARTMFHPELPSQLSTSFVFVILSYVGPMLVECVLLLRIATVYRPRSASTRHRLIAILLFPVLTKIARLVNWGIFVHEYTVTSRVTAGGSLNIVGMLSVPRILTLLKIEWILQLVENTYVSVTFLYRLYSKQSTADHLQVIRPAHMSRRLRGLFAIALSNFVFPVVLNVIQLALLFSSTTTNDSFVRTALVFMVNNYVTIIGVVFATVWSTGSTWADSQGLLGQSAVCSCADSAIAVSHPPQHQRRVVEVRVDDEPFVPSKFSAKRSSKDGNNFELTDMHVREG